MCKNAIVIALLALSSALFLTDGGRAQFNVEFSEEPSLDRLPGYAFLKLVVPEYRAENKPFTQVLAELSVRYRCQFLVEVAVDDEFVEPLITIHATGVTMLDLINQIVRQTGFEEARWFPWPPTFQPGVYQIVLGRVTSEENLMDTVIEKLSIQGEHTAAAVVGNLTYLVPELRELFYRGKGVAGSRSPMRIGIWLEAQNITVRELMRKLADKDSALNILFVLNNKDPLKSSWRPFSYRWSQQ